MKLPINAKPVNRPAGGASNQSQINASQNCAGVPSDQIGVCFDNNGPVPGRWNCQACCALRGAVSWQGGGYAVAC